MDLKHLIFVLLFYLVAGTFVTFAFVKPSEVGRRYFIYHGLGALVLALGAYLIVGREKLAPATTYAFFMFLAFGLIYCLTVGKVFSASVFALAVAVAAAGFAIVSDAMFVVNAILSSLLLGFSMAAMLLGHWYLVQPKLSINELGRVSLVLIALIVIRFGFGTYEIGKLLAGQSEAEMYRYLFGTTQGIFVLMRWAWGLLGPLALAYLVWGTVKIRSTQSATGILYVVVLTILTGETLSQYLALFHGIVC